MWCNLLCKNAKSVCGLLLVSAACCVAAATPNWHDELPRARPIGQGELHWFGLRIYSATLWSERTPFDTQTPFALELVYHRHISHERFVQTSMEEIKRLFDQRFTADKLHEWEMLMSQAFPDVNDGDELVGIFIPHQGCRFYDKNGLRADIRDPDFAAAFFAIWLDPRSKDSELRAHLLGLAR